MRWVCMQLDTCPCVFAGVGRARPARTPHPGGIRMVRWGQGRVGDCAGQNEAVGLQHAGRRYPSDYL